MKAVICTRYGPPEVLKIQDVPKPIPTRQEVCVKIMATAVNSGDVRVRALAVGGLMRLMMRMVLGFNKPRKPVLGTVFAGMVESVGNKCTLFKPGDRVFGMTGFKFGTYAEYIALHEKSPIAHMPEKATFEEAASLIFGGQTAIYFLEKFKLRKRAENNLLVIGASGSVGTAAVQLANYFGATVTAVCSSSGQTLVKNLGAKRLVLYNKEDFTQLQEKFDCIFDAVGKTTPKQCRHLLKAGGSYQTVGGLDYAAESLSQLLLIKKLYEQGVYKAVIDRVYNMEEVVEAHAYVATERKKGNVVLRINH